MTMMPSFPANSAKVVGSVALFRSSRHVEEVGRLSLGDLARARRIDLLTRLAEAPYVAGSLRRTVRPELSFS